MKHHTKTVLLGASWLIVGAAAAHQMVSFAQTIAEARIRRPLVVEIEPAPRAEPEPPKRPLAYYSAITERDIFNPPKAVEAPPPAAPLPPLNLRVLGVSVSDDGDGMAIIEDLQTNAQKLYRLGDSLVGRIISAIDANEVRFVAAGAEEVLTIPLPSRKLRRLLAKPEDRPAYQESVLQPLRIAGAPAEAFGLSNASLDPHLEGGTIAGIRVSAIREGSAFEEVGLRNGDVIKRIGGRAIEDPFAGIQMIQGLELGGRIELVVDRAGRKITIGHSGIAEGRA